MNPRLPDAMEDRNYPRLARFLQPFREIQVIPRGALAFSDAREAECVSIA